MGSDHTGVTIGNRTIIGFAHRRRLSSGKYRDYYVFRCKCGAEWVDIYGNIKARANGACKACSEKGGSGARKNFIGRFFLGREIIELVLWREDAEHSVWKARCTKGHFSQATLGGIKKNGCVKCAQERREAEPFLKEGQIIGNRQIIRYKGQLELGTSKSPRCFYVFKCLLCGAVQEGMYANIIANRNNRCGVCRYSCLEGEKEKKDDNEAV